VYCLLRRRVWRGVLPPAAARLTRCTAVVRLTRPCCGGEAVPGHTRGGRAAERRRPCQTARRHGACLAGRASW